MQKKKYTPEISKLPYLKGDTFPNHPFWLSMLILRCVFATTNQRKDWKPLAGFETNVSCRDP